MTTVMATAARARAPSPREDSQRDIKDSGQCDVAPAAARDARPGHWYEEIEVYPTHGPRASATFRGAPVGIGRPLFGAPAQAANLPRARRKVSTQTIVPQ